MVLLDEVVDHVRRDVELGIGDFFPDGEGFATTEIDGSQDTLWDTDHLVAAVAWKWHGFHNHSIMGVGLQFGLNATGAEVVVEGMTLVYEDENGELRFRRYVDWLGSLAPMGVGLSLRPIIDDKSAADD